MYLFWIAFFISAIFTWAQNETHPANQEDNGEEIRAQQEIQEYVDDLIKFVQDPTIAIWRRKEALEELAETAPEDLKNKVAQTFCDLAESNGGPIDLQIKSIDSLVTLNPQDEETKILVVRRLVSLTESSSYAINLRESASSALALFSSPSTEFEVIGTLIGVVRSHSETFAPEGLRLMALSSLGSILVIDSRLKNETAISILEITLNYSEPGVIRSVALSVIPNFVDITNETRISRELVNILLDKSRVRLKEPESLGKVRLEAVMSLGKINLQNESNKNSVASVCYHIINDQSEDLNLRVEAARLLPQFKTGQNQALMVKTLMDQCNDLSRQASQQLRKTCCNSLSKLVTQQ